jgi:anti-anti-sigma factor
VLLRRSDGVPIIEISGDVSYAIEEDLMATYEKVCQSTQNIIIKFDGSGRIYSSGITLLVRLVSEAEKKGQKIHATGLSEHFAQIFEVIKLTKYIRIFPSEQAILASLK